jgi:hypothetical protein
MTAKVGDMTTITDNTTAMTAILEVLNRLEKQLAKCEEHGNGITVRNTYEHAQTRLRWALEKLSDEVWRTSLLGLE